MLLERRRFELSLQVEHCLRRHPETRTCATEARRDGRRRRPGPTGPGAAGSRAPQRSHKQTVVYRTKDGEARQNRGIGGQMRRDQRDSGRSLFPTNASRETGVLASSCYDFSHDRRQVMVREVEHAVHRQTTNTPIHGLHQVLHTNTDQDATGGTRTSVCRGPPGS